ncbi:MAG: sigma-70 family RNA polymerase sigma factor [Planctomycetota bacterium]
MSLPEHSAEHPGPAEAVVTSLHVQRAVAGNPASLEWVMGRLSPMLLTQATYRLGRRLPTPCEPDDLVQEAWTVLLPRLGTLRPRDGRYTPVLLRFLATVILNRVRNLTRKHLASSIDAASQREALAADASSVLTNAARQEEHRAVTRCLESLTAADREVIVLRGVEQQSAKTTAMLLGCSEEAATKRYQRALARLRQALPRSVFEELDDA